MSVKGYDTNVQLTQTKINVLKADTNWHSLNEKIFVGRYITSVNPNEKRLAPGEYEREAHTLNAMGTRCIVCGYDGPVAYPQKGGTDGETE